MSDHLSPERIEALLAGRLPAGEEAELADHLAGECDACEQVLAGLDPEVERRLVDVLLRIERVGPPPPVALEAILASVDRRSWWRLSWAWGAGLAAAAAALVLIVGMLGTPEGDPGSQRTKGAGPEPGAIELTVGVVRKLPDAPARVRPIQSDETLASGQTLVFRVRTAAAGCHAYLLHWAHGRIRVLWPASLAAQRGLPAGDHPLQQAGRPLGLELEGDPGPQAFWALCSSEAVEDEARLRDLLPARPTELPPQPPEGVSWDRVRVMVSAPGVDP